MTALLVRTCDACGEHIPPHSRYVRLDATLFHGQSVMVSKHVTPDVCTPCWKSVRALFPAEKGFNFERIEAAHATAPAKECPTCGTGACVCGQ